jgi:hypothetical protein
MPIYRKGYLLTNGSGCYIVNREERNEIEEMIGRGWKIGLIRPICTSMAVKVKHLPPEILKQKVYSYSLCILEREFAEGEKLPAISPTDELVAEVLAGEEVR